MCEESPWYSCSYFFVWVASFHLMRQEKINHSLDIDSPQRDFMGRGIDEGIKTGFRFSSR